MNRRLIGRIGEWDGDAWDAFETTYTNGSTAVVIRSASTDEVWGVLSVYVPHVRLGYGEIILNHDTDPRMAAIYLRSELFEDTGKTCSYGFVSGQPIWRLLKRGEVEL